MRSMVGSVLVVIALAECGMIAESTSPPEPEPVATRQSGEPTARELEITADLVEFATMRSADEIGALPLADNAVWLGLADQLIDHRSRDELIDPTAWQLDTDAFRGRVGPFSALDLLAASDEVDISVGPHPHCFAGPIPAPAEVAELRRVSVQPANTDSCLEWWTVDLFLTPDGDIAALTLDLWEP